MMDIHDLLEQKSFEDLDKQERAFVLEQMSQERYENERMAILASQAFFALEEETLPIKAPVPTKALEALQQKQTPKVPVWSLWMHYKIPLWQAVAALCLVFFLSQQVDINAPEIKEGETIVAENRVDTVYIKKYITQIKEVLQPADTIVQVVYKLLEKDQQKPEKHFLGEEEREAQPVLIAEQESLPHNFEDVLEFCSEQNSIPIDKDSFLHLLSSQVVF